MTFLSIILSQVSHLKEGLDASYLMIPAAVVGSFVIFLIKECRKVILKIDKIHILILRIEQIIKDIDDIKKTIATHESRISKLETEAEVNKQLRKRLNK